jgi:hypothetical protein
MRTIQTCGGFDGEVYNITVAFEKHVITLDGLSKEDIYQIASCALCMLPEEEYQELINPINDNNQGD